MARSASARSFIHSLNILVKYTRLYGVNHKRTEGQFQVTWTELQQSLPKTGDGGFVLGVADNKLLLDGIPLEPGQAERSFAQLLTAASLASIHFSNKVTLEDFTRLVRAFAMGGSKAQDFAKQIKETLGDNKNSSIRINEVKFVAADPATGEISVAAQLAAQSLGPEFKEWLNDPQKMLQLIAAAQGATSGGLGRTRRSTSGQRPQRPHSRWWRGRDRKRAAERNWKRHRRGGGVWSGGTVPLQEEEVIQAIRMLTHFGQVAQDPNAGPEDLKIEISKAPEGAKLNLASLLESLSAQVTTKAEQSDTPLLMKAAEHMAIRFALDRYSKGEVKVNAVHQMMEHMSRQMDTLRQILRVQEDKMSKAGILVDSHADILDRMFWAEVPEAGKKSVLLSGEAACVPPRNIRQFVETAAGTQRQRTGRQDSGELHRVASTPRNWNHVARPRSGWRNSPTSMPARAAKPCPTPSPRSARRSARKATAKIQSLLSAAFTRFGQESCTRKNYHGDCRSSALRSKVSPRSGLCWCRICGSAWASKTGFPR